MESFANRLSIARGKKGWTQAELAAKAGMQQKDISAYETGKRSPTARNRQRLMDALELEPGLFTDCVGVELDDDELVILETYRSFRDQFGLTLPCAIAAMSDASIIRRAPSRRRAGSTQRSRRRQ
jgi:transcriptional regulator with XRE-family HTH domain